MSLDVGTILEGKITGISKFGAFVLLENGKSGMVHISEIASGYVTEIKDHISEGQAVKVKVIGIDDKGRINLSIKKAEESVQVQTQEQKPIIRNQPKQQKPSSFEDMMSKFKTDADDKIYEFKSSKERSKEIYAKRQKRPY